MTKPPRPVASQEAVSGKGEGGPGERLCGQAGPQAVRGRPPVARRPGEGGDRHLAGQGRSEIGTLAEISRMCAYHRFLSVFCKRCRCVLSDRMMQLC